MINVVFTIHISQRYERFHIVQQIKWGITNVMLLNNKVLREEKLLLYQKNMFISVKKMPYKFSTFFHEQEHAHGKMYI